MQAKKPAGRLSPLSSLLVSQGVLWFLFAATCGALLWGKLLLCAFLGFVTFIGLVSRLWGIYSLHRVAVRVAGESDGFFAGETARVQYEIRNEKLLPLIWLELLQACPPNDCLVPEEGAFERYTTSIQEKNDDESELPPLLLKKKFAFLLWHQQLAWESVWQAERRGLYPLTTVLLRSGDGFGLAQLERRYPVEGSPVLAVYPKLQPVRAELFLQNLWEARTGARGHFEDPTVLRGGRPYQPGDPWKRINWRMAARGQPLEIRQYETIMPRAVHFILDGGGFLAADALDALEDALSLIGSAAVRLNELSVRCGLSLPADENGAGTNLFAADKQQTVTDLLFCLAGYAPKGSTSLFETGDLLRSREQLGQIYLIVCSADALGCDSLLEELGSYGVTVLTAREGARAARLADWRVLPLDRVRGGGANG